MTLPCSGSTIVECSVQNALESCSRVILVSGYRGDELARLFAGRERVLVVHNADYELGMFSSVQCGVTRVNTERFFLALGDMPLVAAAVYKILLEYGSFDGSLLGGSLPGGQGVPVDRSVPGRRNPPADRSAPTGRILPADHSVLAGRIHGIIPKYRGKKGHPLLLSAEVALCIAAFDREKSMREVLALYPVLTVPVDCEGVLHDIDDAEDYRRRING